MSDKDNSEGLNGNGHYRGKQSLFYYDESRQKRNVDAKADSDEIDLKKLLGILLRRKWTVTALTVLGVAFAWLNASSQLPVYQSEGTLMISESQQRSAGGGHLNDMLATTYGVGLGSRIANELQVL